MGVFFCTTPLQKSSQCAIIRLVNLKRACFAMDTNSKKGLFAINSDLKKELPIIIGTALLIITVVLFLLRFGTYAYIPSEANCDPAVEWSEIRTEEQLIEHIRSLVGIPVISLGEDLLELINFDDCVVLDAEILDFDADRSGRQIVTLRVVTNENDVLIRIPINVVDPESDPNNPNCVGPHCIPNTNPDCIGPNCIPETNPNCVGDHCIPNTNPGCLGPNCIPETNPDCVGDHCIPNTNPHCVGPNCLPNTNPDCIGPNCIAETHPDCVGDHCIPNTNPGCIGPNCIPETHPDCVGAHCIPNTNPDCEGPNCIPDFGGPGTGGPNPDGSWPDWTPDFGGPGTGGPNPDGSWPGWTDPDFGGPGTGGPNPDGSWPGWVDQNGENPPGSGGTNPPGGDGSGGGGTNPPGGDGSGGGGTNPPGGDGPGDGDPSAPGGGGTGSDDDNTGNNCEMVRHIISPARPAEYDYRPEPGVFTVLDVLTGIVYDSLADWERATVDSTVASRIIRFTNAANITRTDVPYGDPPLVWTLIADAIPEESIEIEECQ